MNSIDKFERDLEFKGGGYAPNGARYLLTHFGSQDIPCCERLSPDGKERDTIFGCNGNTFPTLDTARHWAIADGRHEYAPGKPMHERELLG
jgi:hypothetical protein